MALRDDFLTELLALPEDERCEVAARLLANVDVARAEFSREKVRATRRAEIGGHLEAIAACNDHPITVGGLAAGVISGGDRSEVA